MIRNNIFHYKITTVLIFNYIEGIHNIKHIKLDFYEDFHGNGIFSKPVFTVPNKLVAILMGLNSPAASISACNSAGVFFLAFMPPSGISGKSGNTKPYGFDSSNFLILYFFVWYN